MSQASATEEKPRAPVDFDSFFDDTICKTIRDSISVLQVQEVTRPQRLPFMLAPAFMTAFEAVLREMILPSIRKTRPVQAMAANFNWAELGADKLLEILAMGEKNNPILYSWDARWSAAKPVKAVVAAAPVKTGGLLGMLKKQIAPAPVAAKPAAAEPTPWAAFKADAQKHGYEACMPGHMALLVDCLRYDPQELTRCWSELRQLYSQEYEPASRHDQGREGSFRDGLNKWFERLPSHLGEFVAMKCFFEFAKCDGAFIRRYMFSHGKNEVECQRAAPYLYRFVSQNNLE